MSPTRSTSEQDAMQIFLDRAIHDLRASARHVGISAELLSEGLTGQDEQRKPLLDELRRGVDGMNAILKSMGRYAAVLAPSNYAFRRLNLNSSLQMAVAQLQQGISQTGATVSQGDLPEVLGDSDKLAEVFQNLIGNSLVYRGGDPPRIWVEVEREPESWIVIVRDNGMGVERKYCEQVFAPFYRLHGSDLPGTGLGLAICRRIIEVHQGRIWVEPRQDGGLDAKFTLPAGVGETPAALGSPRQ